VPTFIWYCGVTLPESVMDFGAVQELIITVKAIFARASFAPAIFEVLMFMAIFLFWW
jgi:hypothetical protein